MAPHQLGAALRQAYNQSEKCDCADLIWQRLGRGGVWQDADAILGLGFRMAFAGAMLVRQPCWTCLAG